MQIGDALQILPTVPDKHYDVVLAIDILEHFDPEDGRRFSRECRRIARRAALISTPKEFHAQEVPANRFENHRSVWSERDLAELGYGTVLENDESWIVCTTG